MIHNKYYRSFKIFVSCFVVVGLAELAGFPRDAGLFGAIITVGFLVVEFVDQDKK